MKKTCLLLNIVCLLLLGVTEAFAQKNEGTVIYSSPYTIYTPHYGTSVSSVNLTPTNAPKKSKKQKQPKAPKSDQYKDEVNLNIEMPQSTGSRSVFLGVNYGIGFQIVYDPTLKTGVGLDFAYPITNNFGLGAYFSIGNYVSFGALTTIGDYVNKPAAFIGGLGFEYSFRESINADIRLGAIFKKDWYIMTTIATGSRMPIAMTFNVGFNFGRFIK